MNTKLKDLLIVTGILAGGALFGFAGEKLGLFDLLNPDLPNLRQPRIVQPYQPKPYQQKPKSDTTVATNYEDKK